MRAKKVVCVRGTRLESRDDGLYAIDQSGSEAKVAPPVKYLGNAARVDGSAASGLLQFWDQNGGAHELIIPATWTHSDPRKFAEHLISYGYPAVGEQAALEAVREYVIQSQMAAIRRYLLVEVCGWHDGHFLLGSRLISPNGERLGVKLDGPLADSVGKFQTSGSLSKWQKHVACRCAYSDRLLFALCVGFASPLMAFVHIEGGGFNFSGRRDSGKTTALIAAGSIYGGGKEGYHAGWSMTESGGETLCLVHNDLLLCLDELDEFDTNRASGAKRLTAMVQRLSNGGRKAVSHKAPAGTIRQRTDNLFLSSSEATVQGYMAEGGQSPTGGMLMRLVDIPLKLGSKTGVFDRLPRERKTGQPFDHSEFARRIVVSALANYGHAGRSYLRQLVEERHDDPVKLSAYLRARMDYFTEKTDRLLPRGHDRRIQRRFALVYAAGKLALRYEILPSSCSNVFAAVKACFVATIGRETSPHEELLTTAIDALRKLLAASDGSVVQFPMEKLDRPTYSRGKAFLVDRNSQRLALVKKEVFEDLFDRAQEVARCLAKAGVLIRPSQKRFKWQERIHGGKRRQFYRIDLDRLETSGDC